MPSSLLKAFVLTLAAINSLASAAITATANDRRQEAAPDAKEGASLVNFGLLLFPGYDILDVAGAVEALSLAAYKVQQLNLFVIAASTEPVSMEVPSVAGAGSGINKFGSSFFPAIAPTHDLAAAAGLALDVLMLPGGPGMRSFNGSSPLVEFVRTAYPGVKHLLTICTGSGIAAQAGVLDGKKATTNKHAWKTITAMGPNVDWQAPARYVRDGNVWTSSGVAAGLDMMYEFMSEMYGREVADDVHHIIEYDPRPADYDPYTKLFGITPTADGNSTIASSNSTAGSRDTASSRRRGVRS